MLFGKKKYVNKFAEGNDFLKSYATKTVAIMNLTENNETVTDKLNHLKESFVFAISPPQNKEVEKCQSNIERKFDELREVLEQEDWDEKDVIKRINSLETELTMLTSIRA